MKLGEHALTHGLFLAPMAGFTDHAMREICHRMGAEATVTEMISAKAVCYNDKKTLVLGRIYPTDGPCSLQLFGSEEEFLAEAARRLAGGAGGGLPPMAFDINMGCPVPKVFGNGEGSALMRDPKRIERLVRAVVDATPIPVTVKLRAGIDPTSRNAVECALAAEAGGATLVVIHGRTRKEMYAGLADRKIIKNVKSALHIPVIANGDIVSGESALAMLRETGADGLMAGRAAIGNPFLFCEILAALEGRPYTPPTTEERVAAAKEQLAAAVLEKGEELAVREGRKQIALYLRAHRGAAALRAKIHQANTVGEVHAALDEAMRS